MTDHKSSELLELFEPFDDDWKSATRSIRIDGTVTSVRLENFYWRVVARVAQQNDLQVPQVMTQLSKAAKAGDTKHTNFTSFVRVCCGRYLDTRRDPASDSTANSGVRSEVANDVANEAANSPGADTTGAHASDAGNRHRGAFTQPGVAQSAAHSVVGEQPETDKEPVDEE